MLKSTKVKYFGITGTIVLVALSYTLSANTFYKEMYRDDISTPKLINITKKIVLKKTIAPKKEFTKTKSMIKTTPKTALSPFKKVEKILKNIRYISFDKKGDISLSSKETLEKLSPLLADVKDVYIEIEGYSLSLENQDKTQEQSLNNAQKVYAFLQKKDIDKKMKLTGYGDMYPISDDKLNDINSRVELKMRRR